MRLLGLLAQGSALRLATTILASVLGGVAELSATVCVLESFRTGSVLWWQFAVIAVLAVLIGRYSRASVNKLVGAVGHPHAAAVGQIRAPCAIAGARADRRGAAAGRLHQRSRQRRFGGPQSRVAVGQFRDSGGLSGLYRMAFARDNAGHGLLCAVCVGGAVILRKLERRHRHSGREAWDRVVRVFGMVLEGAKQLKLNRSLARLVLLSFEHRVREQQQSAGTRGRYSDLVATWSHAMFYVILGVAVFGPFGNAQLRLEFGVLALLQIRRPLRSLITDSGALADASVGFQRIAAIGLKLSGDETARSGAARGGARYTPPASQYWRALNLRMVQFRYGGGNRKDNFALGPLEMTFRPGELIFIAGANGSGKTTLVKVLTGLYPPTSGDIRFDGAAVDEGNIHWYRANFAVVFADFCLFEGVGDLPADRLGPQAEQLAVRLELNRRSLAALASSGGSTALSSGERRRIALLKAVLENRPILVFDEWTADQDHRYKDFFYREFLPKMRDSGKLVIAVTHDEEYFPLADRVLWLERGETPTWREPSSFLKAEEVIPNSRQPGAEAAAIDK